MATSQHNHHHSSPPLSYIHFPSTSPLPPPLPLMAPISTTLFLLLLTAIAASPLPPPPLHALLSLKASLSDPLSTLSSWSLSSNASSAPWCSFSGVTCHPLTDAITALDLSARNLSGDLSTPAFLLLRPSLSHLNLSSNSFSGPFPTTLLLLRHLISLDISHNDFNSSFPSGLSGLRRLAVFSAYSNSFTGPLPSGLSSLSSLQHLNLGGSFFSGSIPPDLASLSSLRFLHLAGNLLSGSLPPGLRSLHSLQHLEIGYNSFNAGIPAEIGELTSLRYLDISSANLSGEIPSELGNLTELASLFLFKNGLSGRIPESFAGLRALEVFDLSDNQLSGAIPAGLASFENLTLLSLMNNNLSGEIPVGIGELPKLQALLLWNNSLVGGLPPKLGLNGKLEKLDVSSNSLTGPIPAGVCSGNHLVRLILFSNSFDSELPSGLARCASLWRIRIEENRFSGNIPAGFGLLPNLTYMDLSRNNFSGSIPPDLGAAPRLEFLNVSENPLRTALPERIWGSPELQIFSASSCGLTGEVPSFGPGCRNLYKLELAGNELNGSIPMDIGRCSKLLNLKLNQNRLVGIIPPELTTLPSITDIDLSHNELGGPIPPGFDNCSTIENLNVSFNRLSGQVPTAGTVLRNLHPSSFAGNPDLCGEPFRKPCAPESWRREEPENTAKGSAGAAFVWIAAGAVGAGLVVLFIGARWTRSRDEDEWPGPWKLTAFQRLNFTADDVAECVALTDQIIGMGSTGTVYRADMPAGDVIAVKKLWGRHKDSKPGARRSRAAANAAATLAEVQVLGSVRHRNIVRLLGCCSNYESTLLLYEYMPNGSLEDLLHRHGSANAKDGTKLAVDWLTRYRVALGVAQGVCYLHHDCDPVIIHRDLKPSNILLDEKLEPRVADFGVAKLIHSDAKHTMSVIAGSYGYIAPEYAYTLQVDEKSDIYSFGVVLMEIVSGKRSVEAEFGEGNSIVNWVRTKVMKGDAAAVMEVLDKRVGAECKEVREEMLLLLRVALLCTSKNPVDRPSMRDVVSMIREARPNRKVVAAGEECGGLSGTQKFGTNT